MSWDWLVDLSKVEKEVKLVDRWDIRERALEELLGVTAGDVVSFGRTLELGVAA